MLYLADFPSLSFFIHPASLVILSQEYYYRSCRSNFKWKFIVIKVLCPLHNGGRKKISPFAFNFRHFHSFPEWFICKVGEDGIWRNKFNFTPPFSHLCHLWLPLDSRLLIKIYLFMVYVALHHHWKFNGRSCSSCLTHLLYHDSNILILNKRNSSSFSFFDLLHSLSCGEIEINANLMVSKCLWEMLKVYSSHEKHEL